MSSRIILGVVLGLLLSIWTYVAFMHRFPLWQVLVATASFFASGGKLEGFWKTLITLLSGIFWGFLIIRIFINLGLGHYLFSAVIGVVVFIICVQAALRFLSFIPGALSGAAIYFGTVIFAQVPAPWWHSILAVVVGPIIGYVAELLESAITKRNRVYD